MQIFSFAAAGFEGFLIRVEVSIRRGIPAVDIVGLPDGAVREARERIRVAIEQSGFQFPSGRILINRTPADIRKEGASFDLSLAVAVLLVSGQIPSGSNQKNTNDEKCLILGELELSGSLRPVKGTLSAVSEALKCGIRKFILPPDNCGEAFSAGAIDVIPLAHLIELNELLSMDTIPRPPTLHVKMKQNRSESVSPDIKDLKGQASLKRALMVAAAGGHHMLLFGPPGSGKTLAATMLEGLLPEMEDECSFEVSRIWSQAGRLGSGGGILRQQPFRSPHHSIPLEGFIGGGINLTPGEISLAHGGVLFLDETPEFQGRILQSLRAPLENGRVTLFRAGKSYWFPSDFQLVMAANPCPCGNMGRGDSICICTELEINRYWKKIGGALMDWIDIRVPVEAVTPEVLLSESDETSADLRLKIDEAVERQNVRYEGTGIHRNRSLKVAMIEEYCVLSPELQDYFALMARKIGFSSRACHSVLKVSRTIADLAGHEYIEQEDLEEAGQYRRYGDSSLFWNVG
ncbi:YifB family Mg chelatase-like AAA ATPase [Oceanispirochaeta sp.]|jgi:magnesium chelatase family protein|uniref:YifB family Mg chelatase-like AAA ATPase n=1 Tax=Oceanispirochaeta sp. TaxID=2035350 RepID=UPI002621BE36|nr:YifB family Mg chelatase-like AAA ATPase [Oceanispirochaeta sp.]MDA3957319.1 YifB family Mg chelatase-like AAA ATPase [Oceanispirochaeta sp.]